MGGPSSSFPGGSDGKESACNVGDLDSIPGLGRSPGEGNGNPLQYSCLENCMDRGARCTTIRGVEKSLKKVATSHEEQMSPLMILVLPRYEEMSEVGLIKLSENF